MDLLEDEVDVSSICDLRDHMSWSHGVPCVEVAAPLGLLLRQLGSQRLRPGRGHEGHSHLGKILSALNKIRGWN